MMSCFDMSYTVYSWINIYQAISPEKKSDNVGGVTARDNQNLIEDLDSLL